MCYLPHPYLTVKQGETGSLRRPQKEELPQITLEKKKRELWQHGSSIARKRYHARRFGGGRKTAEPISNIDIGLPWKLPWKLPWNSLETIQKETFLAFTLFPLAPSLFPCHLLLLHGLLTALFHSSLNLWLAGWLW